MAGLIEGEEPLPHEVVGGGGLVQMEGNEGGGSAHEGMEKQRHLDPADGFPETDRVAADAFGDDDAFVKVPALGVSGEHQDEVGVGFHTAEAFPAAEHEPHIGGLEGDLALFGLKEVLGDGADAVELDGPQRGD